MFRLLENAFVKLSPSLWHNLIISLPCKTTSLHEFAQKCLTTLRKAFLLRSSDPLKFFFSRVLTLNGPSNFVGPTLFLIEKGKLWSVIIWLSLFSQWCRVCVSVVAFIVKYTGCLNVWWWLHCYLTFRFLYLITKIFFLKLVILTKCH